MREFTKIRDRYGTGNLLGKETITSGFHSYVLLSSSPVGLKYEKKNQQRKRFGAEKCSSL